MGKGGRDQACREMMDVTGALAAAGAPTATLPAFAHTCDWCDQPHPGTGPCPHCDRLPRPARPHAWDQPGGPEATVEEFAQAFPWIEDPAAKLADFLDLSHTTATVYPTRRALEEVLAVLEGEDVAEFKAANAHRPWSELYRQLNDIHGTLTQLASHIEAGHRRYLADYGRPPAAGEYDPPYDPDIREWIEELGPGARSGRLEDWTRKELCQLLGYLQRDAKDFTDDDLRAMALDAHLIPRWPGAPSHAQLAARQASQWTRASTRRREFRKTARAPYHKLCRYHYGYRDDGRRSDEHRLAELEQRYPFLVRGNRHALTSTGGSWMLRVCKAAGIEREHHPDARYQPAAGAQKSFISSLDKRYGDAFRKLGDQFNGARISKVVGHGATGSWKQQAGSAYKSLAFYQPATGEIHLNPRLDKILSKAQQGKAEPHEIYEPVRCLAHEIGHAASNGQGDAAYQSETSVEHTVEEGGAESFSRLYADRLARMMGLWDQPESLRQAANMHGTGSYPKETRTWVALCAAATGQLDRDKLAGGGYQDPEDLDQTGQQFIIDTHTTVPRAQRAAVIADRLAERYDLDRDAARDLVHRTLALPKRRIYQWTRRRRSNGWDTWYEHVKPTGDFNADLASTLQQLAR